MNAKLLSHWPESSRVSDCIKSEAEAADSAVLLAVHQPMLFRRKPFGSLKPLETVESEQVLLERFLDPNPPEGNLIFPIVGESGAGKSHAVKWLEWQLKQDRNADKRQIVRVPKGTSLKGVLKLLLDQLGERYDELRNALENAHEHLDSHEAAERLLDSIRMQLSKAYHDAGIRKKQGNPHAEDRVILGYCGPEHLQGLLLDIHLRETYFLAEPHGVIRQLAQHLHVDAGRLEDTRRHQFEPEDLAFASDFDRDTAKQISPRLRKFVTKTLNRPERCKQAIELLNGVLDRAKGELLEFGDTSLDELLNEVRKRLLADGKELVLLVEDFAVLSGLQGALLQAIVKPGYDDGVEVRCKIRTALAYTPSYEAIKDTVITRAGYEWHLYDDQNEETVRERTISLVGAYLNAARAGQVLLRQRRERHYTAEDVNAWIPRVPNLDDLDEKTRSQLEAFGFCQRGFSLFPFNRPAIIQWARHAAQTHKQEVNARLLIKHVIQRVLQDRTLFAEGTYPPNGLEGTRDIEPTVVNHITDHYPAEAPRRLALLRFWGGQPTTVDGAESIDAGLCQAFGLTPPKMARVAQQSRPVVPALSRQHSNSSLEPNRGPNKPTPNTHASKQCALCDTEVTRDAKYCSLHRKIGQLEGALNAWAKGTESKLSSADANYIRKQVAHAMYRFVRWTNHGLLVPYPEYESILKVNVWLPSAGGSGAASRSNAPFVEVCSEEALKEPTKSAPIVTALLAIAKHQLIGHWNYAGAEEDSAAYAEFLSERAPQAVSFVRRHYHLHPYDDTVPVLTETLLIGARVLGHEGTNGNLSQALDALFRLEDGHEQTAGSTSLGGWDDVRSLFKRQRMAHGQTQRPIRDMLLDQVAYRQGNGRPLAIDVARLLPHLREVKKHWTVAANFPEPSARSGNRAKELVQFHRQHKMLSREFVRIVKREGKALGEWHSESAVWFGDDKEALRECLGTLLDQAEKAAVPGDGTNYKHLREALTLLSSLQLMDTLKNAATASDGEDFGTRLGALGKITPQEREKIEEIKRSFDDFFEAYEANLLQAKNQLFDEGTVQELVESIADEMQQIDDLLETCGEADVS